MQLNSRPRKHLLEDDAALAADAAELHAALAELVRVYQFRDRDKICCHDISVTQCYALEALVEKGPMRSLALADQLMLDKSTTTRVIDALERKGYVERLPDETDARALSLRATRSGKSLYDAINRELIAQQAQMLRDLDAPTRAAAAAVIRRLARAAHARFVSGVSVGDCGPVCGPGKECG
ncbi:MarR family winged helix-turn-helix transcriptional regulator [Tahibacter amnicola]|uniref:MarR family transcriptional regulator n=1 Tax=Tahibacter amnicola TaxID=2976241 RepID=A0ABY6BPS2_9GAMM|nr:MarR family transcriptional regulator [Tahibacter amnicola]UXI70556.1 MarR family transcriptional regulator [Tahibacter amnicola]